MQTIDTALSAYALHAVLHRDFNGLSNAERDAVDDDEAELLWLATHETCLRTKAAARHSPSRRL
jgi:hypothetical protein